MLEERYISTYHAIHLNFFLRLMPLDHTLKAGEYQVFPTLKPAHFITMLKNGNVVYYKVTFIEGWTFDQIKDSLKSLPNIKIELIDHDDEHIMSELGQSHYSPEGRFFPDTYFYTKGFSDKDILLKAMNKMDKQLEVLWNHRAHWITLKTSYEGLILASIIEKEASWIGERAMVSGVLHHRLQKKMKLQCDPTIIYALKKDYQGSLTKDDLKLDSPYNTYRYKGLPPTPIAAPGLSALEAAFNPEKTDALYFVSSGEGSHRFSTTLESHNKAVDLFYESRRENE